ncbi:MAG: hypothetical protein Q8Q33_10235 [Chlamydiota bacterium]|nr:hypothetical protein [Chlamydiota bacterium]
MKSRKIKCDGCGTEEELKKWPPKEWIPSMHGAKDKDGTIIGKCKDCVSKELEANADKIAASDEVEIVDGELRWIK